MAPGSLRSGATGRRRRTSGWVAVVPSIILLVAACGGSAAGGGNGSAGPNWEAIIAETQAAFGTSMVSGTVEGETLTITLVKGFGPGGAKLFMCANVKQILTKYGASGTNVVMVDTDGTELSTMADCSR